MSLRSIVPTLGFLAFASGVASAADAPAPGGVSIGGFVDTIGSVTDTKDDDASAYYNFQAAVELRLGYRLGEKVGAKVDVEWNNGGGYNGHPSEYVEQAFVNWQVADPVSVTGGKFTSYAGWVSADADGLYRINAGPIVRMYESDLVGGAVNVAPNKDLGISLFLVNDLGLTTPQGAGVTDVNGWDNANNDKYLSPAIDVVYTIADFGSLNGEFGYDYHGDALSAWELGLNATIKPKSYDKLTLGAEALFEKISDDDGTSAFGADTNRDGFLLMANHVIPFPCPASVTLMGQYILTDSDLFADKEKTLEVAAALLTNPTGDSKFGVNLEVSYQVAKDGIAYDTTGLPAGAPTQNTGDDVKTFAAAIEMLAVIP